MTDPTQPTTAADLTELRRLLEGATDGPWQWLDGDGEKSDELQDGHGEMVATAFRDDVLPDVTDGRLCAALRNAAPALLDLAEARQQDDSARRAALELAIKHFIPDYDPTESGIRPDAARTIIRTAVEFLLPQPGNTYWRDGPMAQALREKAGFPPSTPPTLNCIHAEGCICIEVAHASCCGILREKVLANTSHSDYPSAPPALDVERLAKVAYALNYHMSHEEADAIAAEYARLEPER